MKKILVTLLIVCTTLIQIACNNSASFTEEEIDTILTNGTTAFEERDLDTAQETYCDSYDAGNTDAQVAFGCFLSTTLLLPESNEATTILASLNEDAIDTETDILDSIVNGYSSSVYSSRGIFGFSYTSYSHLPLNHIFNGGGDFFSKSALIINELVSSGTSLETFKSQVYALITHFEYMETLLEDVLADTSFSYTIPAELFYLNNDATVEYNNVRFMMAGVKSTLVALEILNAYNYGVDVTKILNSSGDGFHNERLVEDLNGTGSTVDGVTVDSTVFLTLESGSGITASRSKFIEAIDFTLDGLDNLTSDERNSLYNTTLGDYGDYNDTVTFLEELKLSTESEGLVSMSGANIELDLYTFFNNPPSATSTTVDPFIYNSDENKVELVESFFRELLEDTGIASF